MASMNYFDYDMSNSIYTVVHFDGKGGHLLGCSIFQLVKFEQTIIHQRVL